MHGRALPKNLHRIHPVFPIRNNLRSRKPSPKIPSSFTANTATMEQLLRDTVGMGALLWLAGYLASMAVYFSPLNYAVFGRVVLALYIPVAAWAAWRYFTGRGLSLLYYAGTGVAWSLTAIILDYPFIVLRFGAYQYYTPDVYLYYGVMFLIPVGVGMYLDRQDAEIRRNDADEYQR